MSRVIQLVLAFAVFLLFGEHSLANTVESRGAVALLSGSTYLGKKSLIYEDKSGKKSLNDVLTLLNGGYFQPCEEDAPNFGLTRSAVWFYFSIVNPSDAQQSYFVEVADARIQIVDIYVIENGVATIIEKMGGARPFSAKPVTALTNVFPLTVPAGRDAHILVRLKTNYALVAPLKLWAPKAFHESSRSTSMALAVYFGVILSMLAYNGLIWLTLRDTSYGIYTAFLFFSFCNFACFYGFADEFIFEDSPKIIDFIFQVSYPLMIFSSAVFSGSLFEFKFNEKAPKAILLIVMTLCLGSLFFSICGFSGVGVAINVVAAPVAIVYAIFQGVLGLKTGSIVAKYFLFGWSAFLFGALLMALAVAGWLPYSAFVVHSMVIGSAAEMILLSMALSARIRKLKEDHFQVQKMALENERKSVVALQRMDKLKDDFLANTSHELRTPLNGMIGLAEGILFKPRSSVDLEDRRHLEMIISSGRRLNTLVNDILDFSKLRHAELHISQNVVDLHAITDIVLTLLKPLASDKGLTLRNTVSTQLPSVWADPARLQQILHNLVGNAIKFTAEGKVEVSAQTSGALVEVTVVDTGMGIPADRLGSIFESFNQGDGSISREFGGTGLGLSVAQQLVRLHGGEFRVTSEVGKGSVFTFTLPVANEKSEPSPVSVLKHSTDAVEPNHSMVSADDTLPVAVDRFSGSQATYAGHLLVVDDEPINREVLRSQLEAVGYRVSCAVNGVGALGVVLDAVHTESPVDLVLLDVMMPKISGFEVCRALRQQFSAEILPVLFLTAKSQEKDTVTGFEVGGSDYLTKPFSRDELLARVRVHLELHHAHKQLQDQHQHLQATQAHLIQQEKMASLGLLSAGIAHEIKNPLNFMTLSNQTVECRLNDLQQFIKDLLSEDADDELIDAFRQHFAGLYSQTELIKEGSQRVQSIIAGMRAASRRDEAAEKQPIDPIKGLLSTVELVKANWKTLVDFNVSGLSQGFSVMGYGSALNQVFTNLMVNAAQSIEDRLKENASGPRGRLRMYTRVVEMSLLIQFEDNGTGMSEAVKAKLFTPFFTTKNHDRGTGLGMAICVGILDEHGGQLTVESTVGEGTVFTITLPLI